MPRLAQRLLARVGSVFNQAVIEEMRAQRKQILATLKETEERVGKLAQALEKTERIALKRQAALDEQLRQLSRGQAELRLLMTRLDQPTRGRTEGGVRIALSSADLAPVAEHSPESSALPRESILEISVCPICGDAECTHVCEYNKLFLLESGVDQDASVYRYAMCHACGVVSARRRPIGERYKHLLNRFESTLGRAQDGVAPSGNQVLSSAPLTDEDRRLLRERVGKGVFVSEHLGLRRSQFLPALLQDRLSNSVHIELLGSLLQMKAPRVIELRPRLGSIGAALQRLYGAEVYGMPLFDGQQFLIQETYGIPSTHKVDYDRFSIPYEGQFDLVIANHMFTHSLRPRELFATLRERLSPDSHVYLYNEPDERDFLEDGKSMFNSLNAFHVQTFDGRSMARALGALGFETVFMTHHHGNLIALARPSAGKAPWVPMDERERERRVAAYRDARDLAILRLPDRLRGHFAGEWDAIVERAFAAGRVSFDAGGRLRLVKADRGEDD
jgi:hypothetical protein